MIQCRGSGELSVEGVGDWCRIRHMEVLWLVGLLVGQTEQRALTY